MIFTLKTYDKGFDRYSKRAYRALFFYAWRPSTISRKHANKNHRICRLINQRLLREYDIAKAYKP